MRCEHVDPLIEEVADDATEPGVDVRAHLASCARCSGRLRAAREIHAHLITREVPAPPPGFTAGVMARIQRHQWQTERAIDIGFNVAVAGGILLILGGGLGLAWSLGVFSLDITVGALLAAVAGELSVRLVPNIQTFVLAGALLTMALGVWWWTETDLSF